MAGISPASTHAYDRELHPEKWPAHPDGPYVLFFHDRDISLQHEFVERTFEALPEGVKTISMNHYVGILHTRIKSTPDGFGFEFEYDEPYCNYFAKHASSWRLMMADPLLETIKRMEGAGFVVDGKATRKFNSSELLNQPALIQIPAGAGQHTWRLEIK